MDMNVNNFMDVETSSTSEEQKHETEISNLSYSDKWGIIMLKILSEIAPDAFNNAAHSFIENND